MRTIKIVHCALFLKVNCRSNLKTQNGCFKLASPNTWISPCKSRLEDGRSGLFLVPIKFLDALIDSE